MDIAVHAKKLRGNIKPPPFKSEVIRVLILSALCGVPPREVLERGRLYCDDVLAAESAVEAAFFRKASTAEKPIPVGSSAALLRMLTPVLLFMRTKAVFSCEQQLMGRDLLEAERVLACKAELDKSSGTVVYSGGRLGEKEYVVFTDKSSQFASGMLIAAALTGFRVRIVSPVSMPYIRLTLDCLKAFGCKVTADEAGFYRPCGTLKKPARYAFRPDMSYAANFIAADLISGANGDIIIEGAKLGAGQDGAAITELFYKNELDISDEPDLFPLLCILALKKNGDTVISGVCRLADKESDRVLSTRELIFSLGGSMDVSQSGDRVTVHGCGGRLRGGLVQGFGDHRIVMAAAVASLMCEKAVIIRGAEAVSKSAPRFFDDFRLLGGTVDEYVW